MTKAKLVLLKKKPQTQMFWANTLWHHHHEGQRYFAQGNQLSSFVLSVSFEKQDEDAIYSLTINQMVFYSSQHDSMVIYKLIVDGTLAPYELLKTLKISYLFR